jgi:CheY-like chemotaxis protein
MKMLTDDPAGMEEVRSTMERQTQQMVRLIDDLLEVSRISQGKLELRKAHVDLANVLRSAVEATRPIIDEAGHRLTVKLPLKRVVLDGDPNRLAQVFSNLLNNAAKYTPEGGRIVLSVKQENLDVFVTVSDTGLGIPREMQARVFEMFTQIDRSMEKGYPGLGIGLALVKKLVEMHGGDISVQSDGPNLGSSFAVRLPVLLGAHSTHVATASDGRLARPQQLRILVVDDNQAAAETLGKVVKLLGNEVRVANDGLQGVEAAAEFLPQVVLMDLGMPRMNGYEAARHIRAQDWGKRMMLVALTGWGQDEDRRRTKEAGFDHHLVKPAEPAELQKLFAEVTVDPA